MKKLIIVVLVCLLSGCSSIDSSTKKVLESSAREIIGEVHVGKFEFIYKKSSLFFKSSISVDQLKAQWESLPDVYGEYIGVDQVVSYHIDNNYIVYVVVIYENYKQKYSLSFNENLKLIGMFLQ